MADLAEETPLRRAEREQVHGDVLDRLRHAEVADVGTAVVIATATKPVG